MANAIKQISIARGHDVTRYTLALLRRRRRPACLPGRRRARHGAGDDPSARRRAQRLWHGPRRHGRAAAAERSAARTWRRCWRSWTAEAVAALRAQGVEAPEIRRRAALALRGQRYRARGAGRAPDDGGGVRRGAPGALRLRVAGHARSWSRPRSSRRSGRRAPPAFAGRARPSEVGGAAPTPRTPPPASPVPLARTSGGGILDARPLLLARATVIPGPALIVDPSATTVVEPGWQAEVDPLGNLILTRAAPRDSRPRRWAPRSIRSCSRCWAICSWRSPRRWASRSRTPRRSVNIKERLDFSCALFDRDGSLIANAPHIPVHLGSMGDSIRTIIEARGEGRDGRGMQRGRRLCAERPLSRRHPSARHHRDHAGLRRGRRRGAGLVRRRARPSCRYRRDRAGIDAAGQPRRRTRKAC